MKREYLLFLKDILECIQFIENFIGELNFDELVADEKTSSAIIRKIEIIGEASKNIPEEVKQQFAEVPWKEMGRMRDKLIHWYFDVDYDIVWKVVKEEIPQVKRMLQKVLVELENRK